MKLRDFFQDSWKNQLALEDKARIFSAFQEKRQTKDMMGELFDVYVSTQKHTSLTEERKTAIFQRMQTKKRATEWFWIMRARNWVKVGSFVWLFLFVSGILFLWNYQWDPWTREENDWYIWFNVDETLPVIYAEKIGRIIETSWWVSITTEWVEKNADHLAVSDKVKLLPWAELVFNVQDDLQAKIVGPAEFSLEKNDDTYVINMISGEYVELKSLQDTAALDLLEDDTWWEWSRDDVPPKESEKKNEIKTDKVFVTNVPLPSKGSIANRQENKEEEGVKKPIKLVVKTPTFEVASDSTEWEVDMIIREEDGKQMVENTWWDVIITKVIKNKRVVTQLKSQQIASINGEVTVLETVVGESEIVALLPDDIDWEEAKEIADSIKNEDIKISYKLSGDGIDENEDENVENKQLQEKTVLEKNTQNTTQKVQPLAQEDTNKDTWSSPVSLKKEAQNTLINLNSDVVDLESWAIVQQKELLEDNKRVIWWDDLQSLVLATNTSLLMWHIRWLVENRAHGEYSAAQRSLSWLSWLLSPLSENILWWMNLDSTSPSTLAASLQSALANIEAKWYIPPLYTNKLKSVIARLRLVDTLPTGTVDRSCLFDCIVVDVLRISSGQRSFFLLPTKSSYTGSANPRLDQNMLLGTDDNGSADIKNDTVPTLQENIENNQNKPKETIENNPNNPNNNDLNELSLSNNTTWESNRAAQVDELLDEESVPVTVDNQGERSDENSDENSLLSGEEKEDLTTWQATLTPNAPPTDERSVDESSTVESFPIIKKIDISPTDLSPSRELPTEKRQPQVEQWESSIEAKL